MCVFCWILVIVTSLGACIWQTTNHWAACRTGPLTEALLAVETHSEVLQGRVTSQLVRENYRLIKCISVLFHENVIHVALNNNK